MIFPGLPAPLILGSASPSRAALVEAAGLDVTVDPADIDERSIRKVLNRNGDAAPADVAEVLARAKAETVSERHPGSLVIGSDQILALNDRIFEKPETMEDARQTLLALQGKTHQLHTAVALSREGKVHWAHVETAELTMRVLSPNDIGRYLAVAGDDILSSVGAYKLESIGVQLFEKIVGDYFTVLGLPLVALLNQLRREGSGTS
ncbi:MAG: Maf family nucleotide pyrophosphatase [Hyphomicrobiaceae bacterium]|nr:Maf family nucleotide pyrophosphatase [Hyphomicrobiaceae bacterium]